MAGKKTGKRQASVITAASLAVAGLASAAAADTQPTYDKRIEEAAIRMLIPKLGDMRGSLDLKSDEYLRPLANQRVIEKRAADMPSPLPAERATKGSFLFF